jgi:uncharacterized membrane protein YecN with MAPEG domain
MTAAPVVAALYAAIIGLLAAMLTVNVIRNRVALKIDDGDGSNATMRKCIRAHANLAQHAPLALLLIGFAESIGTSRSIIHTLGAVLVLARLLSAWGLLSSEGPTFGRQSGAGLTVLVLLAASALILLREGGMM